MAKSKIESKFQSELSASKKIVCPGAFMYKIPDMPIFSGNKMRFCPPKPFDMIMIWRGKTIAIETKTHTKHTAWPINNVKDHQVEALQVCKNNGIKACILLNVRYGRGNQRKNFAVIIDIEYFGKLIEGRKSIKVDELEKLGNIEWVKNGDDSYWDISRLFI